MDALLNELAFQKVLLNSIDDTVQNREAAEEEVRAEIRTLEKQIRDLKRGTTTASNSQPPGSASQSSQSRSLFSSKKPDPAPGHSTPSATVMDAYQSKFFSSTHVPLDFSQAHLWDTPLSSNLLGFNRHFRYSNAMADGGEWHNLSSTASTPNSADSMGDFLSPSRMNLPTRKRTHSKHLDGALLPIEDNKSRRTSPSPFLAGPSTPSTISSGYGPMLGEGYFNLTLFVHIFTSPLSLFSLARCT
jgi:hypothetical protein